MLTFCKHSIPAEQCVPCRLGTGKEPRKQVRIQKKR